MLGRVKVDGGDLAIFLLSLLLAFSIWLGHNLTMRYSSLVSIPVVAQSNLTGRSAESSNTVTIVARCRTSGYSLLAKNRKASHKKKPVYFSADDLHHLEGDLYSISNTELGGYVNEIFGDDVQLESFVTSSAEFRFPEETYKKVAVAPISVISFKPQFTALESLQMTPDSVIVYGEPSQLSTIDRILTETITLQNLGSGVNGVAKLEIPKGVRLSANEVSYSLEVTRYVELKTELPVSIHNVPSGHNFNVYPSTVEISLKCVFPLGYDPTDGLNLYIEYDDFSNSISGKCIPHISGLSSSVIDYSLRPEVLECFEQR